MAAGSNKQRSRRLVPSLRRKAARARTVAKRAQATLGDIVAAAFDAVGGSVEEAVALMERSHVRTHGKRITFC
jgi:GR25 family glycosyltransferase involved in LPS biosynthesis